MIRIYLKIVLYEVFLCKVKKNFFYHSVQIGYVRSVNIHSNWIWNAKGKSFQNKYMMRLLFISTMTFWLFSWLFLHFSWFIDFSKFFDFFMIFFLLFCWLSSWLFDFFMTFWENPGSNQVRTGKTKENRLDRFLLSPPKQN